MRDQKLVSCSRVKSWGEKPRVYDPWYSTRVIWAELSPPRQHLQHPEHQNKGSIRCAFGFGTPCARPEEDSSSQGFERGDEENS